MIYETAGVGKAGWQGGLVRRFGTYVINHMLYQPVLINWTEGQAFREIKSTIIDGTCLHLPKKTMNHLIF